MISVRDMKFDDVPDVYKLLVALFDESAMPQQNVDFSKGVKHLYDLVENPGLNKVFIAIEDDTFIGVMKCFLSTYWYSNDCKAVHDILYVIPEKRGGTAAIMLLGAFERWAAESGAIFCTTSAFLHEPEALMTFRKLMKNASYDCIGAIYKRDVTNVRR